MIAKLRASIVDGAMCASMNFVQARHRLAPGSRASMEDYVRHCEQLSAGDYFDHTHSNSLPAIEGINEKTYCWQSPIESRYPRNNVARVDLFPCAKGWDAPTVIMLHALMSASDIGYKRWAARWNALGWSACSSCTCRIIIRVCRFRAIGTGSWRLLPTSFGTRRDCARESWSYVSSCSL